MRNPTPPQNNLNLTIKSGYAQTSKRFPKARLKDQYDTSCQIQVPDINPMKNLHCGIWEHHLRSTLSSGLRCARRRWPKP